MKKRFAIALLATGLLAVAGMAQAPPPGPPEAPPPPAIVATFLGFTEEQAQQFRQLLEQREQAAHDLAQQLGSKQRELEQLVNSAAPDPAAVGRLLLELRALQQQAGQIVRAARERFVQLLTPEQKEKLGQVEQAAQLLPAITAFIAVQLIFPPRFP